MYFFQWDDRALQFTFMNHFQEQLHWIDCVSFSCLLLKRRGLATGSRFGGTGCCTMCPGVDPCRQPTTFKIAATQSDLHLYVLIINSWSRHDLLSQVAGELQAGGGVFQEGDLPRPLVALHWLDSSIVLWGGCMVKGGMRVKKFPDLAFFTWPLI